MEFRKLNKKELKTILSAFRANGFELDDKEVVVREVAQKHKKIKEVLLLSRDLLNFLNNPDKNLRDKLVFAGIKVGEVGKRFRFSLEGSYYIARKKRKRVYVNDRGEMLFLYGRDIFSASVVKVTDDVRENDVVMVCNRDGDVLGIGKSRFNAEIMRSVDENRVVVENLVDRGEYLRKKRLYDAY
ncbi:hypothetical protein DRP05_04450 [Archaeoglobales archaeon]|nr:MAG: hypothetical protein DRP05_04450 [Archaeoglobales archaeon]